MSRSLVRLGVVAAVVVAFVVGGGAVAVAHVSVHADEAVQGGATEIAFRVPNESDTASTVTVRLQLPMDTPIAEVSVLPLAGWRYEVTRTTPPDPVPAGHGREVSEVVSEIAWHADVAVKPGEYQVFRIAAGPLPRTDRLVFKVVQTYDDGLVRRWIDEPVAGEPEPEHPAPVLALDRAAAAAHGHDEVATVVPAASSQSTSPSTSWWATTMIALMALVAALGAVVVAVRTARRRGGESPAA